MTCPHCRAIKLRGICLGRKDDATAWKGYSVTVKDCKALGFYVCKKETRRYEKDE